MVSHRLNEWGYPYTTPTNETLTLIAAELTANAVRHGHVPGRDFHLRLTLGPNGTVFRVEVTDTRAESQPTTTHQVPDGDTESGRGLLLVDAPPPARPYGPSRISPHQSPPPPGS
ncbi:ATP-binding protein [Streptomyces sp. NBC_00576]|uniref:ATP-binding protein n=1 Tax=Streptomyces sp. NBC_00576 TaxID=2903665 RepID=UPI002E80EB77|nr:ATP-binding protein [Streptomyces sp. NBC_00576]